MMNNIKEQIYKKTGYEIISIMKEEDRFLFSCFNERDDFAIFYLYEDGSIRSESGEKIMSIPIKDAERAFNRKKIRTA